MNLVQHYNDLTEINGLRYWGESCGYYPTDKQVNDQDKFNAALAKYEKNCKTRVLFTDVKNQYSTYNFMKDAPGWVHARHTLDWHSSHGGDYGVNLFYKLFPENNSDLKDKQERKQGTYMCHQSLSGSCAMGLVNDLDKWLQSPRYPNRYITVVRLQRKRTPEEIAKMRYFQYRLAFKSDVARYFVNGWIPNEYPFKTDQKERDWWESKEAPTLKGWNAIKKEKFTAAKSA